jgi:hypothetical protein
LALHDTHLGPLTGTLKITEKNHNNSKYLDTSHRLLDDVCHKLLKAVRVLLSLEGLLREGKPACTDDSRQHESNVTQAKNLVTMQMTYIDSLTDQNVCSGSQK